MQRSKTLALMFLLGATLVGGALGFTADRLLVKDRLCLAGNSNERDFRRMFYDEIGLTAEQRSAWEALLNERRRATAALNATIRPRVDSIRQTYWRNATALLDSAQHARLEKWRADQRERERLERERRERERENQPKDLR